MTHPIIHALVELGSEPPQPNQPADDSTEAVVAAMMRENTGRHMLDSGGAYGRSWEHNQGRDFASEPEVVASWKWDYIDVTLNLYHFLTNTLEYLPELDRKFHEWSNQGEMKGESWFACIEEFVDQLQKASDSDPEEPFASFLAAAESNPWSGGDIRDNAWTVNTYNHDSLLSQVIQYTMVGNLVFLQVHGGCDVRGGYTQPRIFQACEDWPSFIDDAKATIWCAEGCVTDHSTYQVNSSWQTDDGYHWYFDGGTGPMQLEEYAPIDVSEDSGRASFRARQIVREVLGDRGEEALLKGFPAQRAYDSTKDVSWCPICNEGTLEVGY